jgi:histidinol-phosphate/aromatic aminotransferase/cobyric acid decarboxylase-like protein
MDAIRKLAAAAHYYPSPGADELCKAIGKYLSVRPEQVVVGGGSSTLMHAIMTRVHHARRRGHSPSTRASPSTRRSR